MKTMLRGTNYHHQSPSSFV